MTRVSFYDHAEDELLKFAVIIAKTDGKWVFASIRTEIPWNFRADIENRGDSRHY